MAKKTTDELDSISEINVVPLVDIILVVLIIFMVTAPVIMKEALMVNLPLSSSGESTEKTTLEVAVAGQGQIYIGKKEVSLPQLLSLAQAEVVRNPLVQAVIAADKDVPHGKVVAVMDMVKKAGVKKFAISIDKSN